ncbi:hypothetical protein PROFUN_15672 [Planoprotostelium fungivorum]|uniref:Uncharacterized protein n=1 Tax=Planoprotostelium fungivorum TaxID=1890364 RepID=A0A2P6MS64_9EUKA|nr:hypothetical protein PROFUN_15672 [Planoprotostelium fungivorum]
MTQWWNSAYNDVIIQLPQSIVDCLKHRIQNTKIRGKKCELNEESENLKGLFERELTTYNNKKQCMKMNNKRYEERLQELLEEKEKEYVAEIKRVQVECTSKTMSLELQLEEMLKTIEQKDKFITKQMMVKQAGKKCVVISHKTAIEHKKKHKTHNNACLTTLWFSKQAGRVHLIKMCVESVFLADDNRNTTLKTHPHAPVSHATMWQGYYHLGCSVFYPVCIKHALSTQKLTNVLQRIYKLITGSKHSVCVEL